MPIEVLKVIYKRDTDVDLHNNEPWFLVLLSDGSAVDLLGTEEGANAFLQGYSNIYHFFSNAVLALKEIRNSPVVTTESNERHRVLCCAIYNCTEYVDKGIFRERISKAEIQCWVNYAMQEVKTMTPNSKWMKNGDTNDIDHGLLGTLSTFSCHPAFVALAFEHDLFRVLTDFIKGSESLPSPPVCYSINAFVLNSFQVATKEKKRSSRNWRRVVSWNNSSDA